MTTVGFIGSGGMGSTIARLAVEAGHQVVLSNSRGPETLADTAAELGPRAFAATSGEAAAAGDIVVITVPVKAFPTLPAAPLAGKTVIDTCNYGPERDGHIPELDSTSLTSSELLLRYTPDAMVVKAFNNIFFKHLLSLARPAAADRSYLPIARDAIQAGMAAHGNRDRGWRAHLRVLDRAAHLDEIAVPDDQPGRPRGNDPRHRCRLGWCPVSGESQRPRGQNRGRRRTDWHPPALPVRGHRPAHVRLERHRPGRPPELAGRGARVVNQFRAAITSHDRPPPSPKSAHCSDARR